MSLQDIIVNLVEAHGRASEYIELFFKTYVRMSLREIVVNPVEAHGRASLKKIRRP